MKKTFNFFLAIITATAMVCSCDPSQNDPETPPVENPDDNTGGENEGDQGGENQATDLSATATANCYIVPAAGTYKIKTVKGNSTDSVGEVASAELLWSYSTFGGFDTVVQSSTVSYADGYVTFTTTGSDGNALITAKDASGNILWSWHIWAIAEVPEIQLGGATVQKYPLGYSPWPANDAYSWGLLYQWGRKDPFGIKFAVPESPSGIFNTAVNIADAGVIGEDGTALAYTTAHPNHFITCNETTCDWYAAEAAKQNNGLWAETKTIHDPCPAGYVVAPTSLFQGIDTEQLVANIYPNQAGTVEDPVRRAITCEGNDFFYSGYVQYKDTWSVWTYSGAWVWSRDTPAEGAFANSCFIIIDENGINLNPAKGWYRGTAMPVRCAKQ